MGLRCGCRVQAVVCRTWGVGHRCGCGVQAVGCRMWGVGHRVHAECGVQAGGHRVLASRPCFRWAQGCRGAGTLWPLTALSSLPSRRCPGQDPAGDMSGSPTARSPGPLGPPELGPSSSPSFSQSPPRGGPGTEGAPGPRGQGRPAQYNNPIGLYSAETLREMAQVYRMSLGGKAWGAGLPGG